MNTDTSTPSRRIALRICAVAAAALLSGCVSWPWEGEKPLCTGSGAVCTRADALRAYAKANEFCQRVVRGYQSSGTVSRSTKLAIGITGALAGGVAVPLANGSAKDAWAGLSGATNGLQTQVDQAFLGAVAAQRAKAVDEALGQGQAEYEAADDATEKVEKSIAMASRCVSASLARDQEMLKRIADPIDARESGNEDDENAAAEVSPPIPGPNASESVRKANR